MPYTTRSMKRGIGVEDWAVRAAESSLDRYAFMSDEKPYDEPSKVEADGGVVTVDGPDGVDVALTPDAAIETSDRLLEKAQEARGQQVLSAKGIRGAAPRKP